MEGTKDKGGESKVRSRMLDVLHFQRNQQEVVACDSDISCFSKTSNKAFPLNLISFYLSQMMTYLFICLKTYLISFLILKKK